MNVHASDKESFIPHDDVPKLFKELYNICKITEADGHFYYCYCNNKASECYLCKFSNFIYHNKIDEFVLVNRNNKEKLLELVDKVWYYVRKIRKEDTDALDFFNKRYSWNFKDYKNHIDISLPLEECIQNDIGLLERNGQEQYYRYF